jgi:hypothetical protein
MPEVDAAACHCIGVSCRRLRDHFARRIYSRDAAVRNTLGHELYTDAGPKTDLQHLVSGSDIEEANDFFRGQMIGARHDDATEPSQDAFRTAEHAHQDAASAAHCANSRCGSRVPRAPARPDRVSRRATTQLASAV